MRFLQMTMTMETAEARCSHPARVGGRQLCEAPGPGAGSGLPNWGRVQFMECTTNIYT